MIATKVPQTIQEFFNNAWQHAVVEKHPPCIHDSQCMYRGENNNACLIGISIPDEDYNEIMETKRPNADIFDRVFSHIPSSERTVLVDLQRCHDKTVHTKEVRAAYTTEVEKNLRLFAAFYGLDIPGE